MLKKTFKCIKRNKKAEIIKYKKRTPGHKKLLNLFDDSLHIILTEKTLESRKEENEDYENEYKNEDDEYENEHEYKNEDDEYENENEDKEYENEDDDETINGLNDSLDEIIEKSKSFEDQIESLKKLEGLKEYLPYKDYDDKELKSNYIKIELADMSNQTDKKLFEQIFDHKLIKLADKLINTTNKEENQIIVNSINKNNDKLYEKNDFGDWVIQTQQCSDLKYTIDLILDFSKTIQLDLV